MNEAPALSLHDIHAFRGERHLLRGVSVTVKGGQLLHVTGPNGSGKTTLLRVMTGLLRPEQGEVRWAGVSIQREAASYQRQLAYGSHEPALKGDLSALENLRFAVGLKRNVLGGELERALAAAGIAHCAELPARVLSAGQKRRLAMARILAMQARLWLLDEPFTNLDSAGSALLSQLLDAHIAAGGSAVVVAHHDLALTGPTARLELKP